MGISNNNNTFPLITTPHILLRYLGDKVYYRFHIRKKHFNE